MFSFQTKALFFPPFSFDIKSPSSSGEGSLGSAFSSVPWLHGVRHRFVNKSIKHSKTFRFSPPQPCWSNKVVCSRRRSRPASKQPLVAYARACSRRGVHHVLSFNRSAACFDPAGYQRAQQVDLNRFVQRPIWFLLSTPKSAIHDDSNSQTRRQMKIAWRNNRRPDVRNFVE